MIKHALDTITTALREGGITATYDPPEIHPPGAWISARRLDRNVLIGHTAVVVDIFLIARDVGIPTAIMVLDDLLERALEVADRKVWEIESTALDETVTLPHGGGPLPAYRLTIIYE